MNYTYIRGICTLILLFFLSGCLYPQGELAKNQVPNEIQLETVQSAVDKYRKKNRWIGTNRNKRERHTNLSKIFNRF